MFSNPFSKKKDEGFKLDEYSLPKVSEGGSSDFSEQGFPSSGESSSTLPPVSSVGNNSADNMGVNQGSIFPSSQQNMSASNLGGQSTVSASNSYSANPFEPSVNDVKPIASSSEQSSSNLNTDIIKAKMDSVESRMTLLDTRLSNIDQKLDYLLRLVENEISDETKKKIKINQMMGQVKNQ